MCFALGFPAPWSTDGTDFHAETVLMLPCWTAGNVVNPAEIERDFEAGCALYGSGEVYG